MAVETGREGPGWVELLTPLPADAQVVTTGQSRLADGTTVVVRTPGNAATTSHRHPPLTAEPRPNHRRGADPMTISDVCIKRPVFTWVLVALPVVLGMVSYGNLGVDLFPTSTSRSAP